MRNPSMSILLISLHLIENNVLIKSVKDFPSLFSLNYDCSKDRRLIHHKWLLWLNHGLKDSFPSFQNERQNKIHTPFQQQSLVYPNADPIPYAIPPQNVLSLAQPVVVLPFPQPEIMEVPKVKENIFPRSKVMPFLKSPIVPLLNSQIQSLTDLENPHFPQSQPQPQPQPLPLSLLQPLMHQIPQPLPQTPVLTPQPLLSIPQSKVLAFPQQVMPFPQIDMPPQAFLLYQEPSHEAHPVTQPLAPVYSSAVVVSPNLLILLSHLWHEYGNKGSKWEL